MAKEEFYIGWKKEASRSFALHVKKVITILLVAVTVIGLSLALFQKKFGTGNFEFGRLTEVNGVYFSQPVPSIKVVSDKDIFGNFTFVTIPLVGFGKFGADGIIADMEKERNTSLHRLGITLKGTLLYNDGKLLMQIDANDKPLVGVNKDASPSILPSKQDLGEMKIKGEIVDPKCFFGVMKPGQGKPHKDCAIRCILGGIPPMFRTMNEKGEANYYLLVGPNGERMNEAVKEFVAQPVELEARAMQQDDWIILYTNEKTFKHISYFNMLDKEVALCEAVCTK